MSEEELSILSQRIYEVTGTRFSAREWHPVSGGCINEGGRLTDGKQSFFVKWNRADRVEMFEAEEEALREMAASGDVRVPLPIVSGSAGRRAFLVLEWIPLRSMNARAEAGLGQQLALWHSRTGGRFGWHRNNTIGLTPQMNRWNDNWVSFWKEERLDFQIKRSREKGLELLHSERLLASLEDFFVGYDPVPSPCHGDLWGGNAAMDIGGNPVVFDPAFYFGDRETDLAFTEMFGGFGPGFYKSYSEVWPLDDGYEQRRDVYNLYHVLNHFNLFGGGYGQQAEGMIRDLIAQIN